MSIHGFSFGGNQYSQNKIEPEKKTIRWRAQDLRYDRAKDTKEGSSGHVHAHARKILESEPSLVDLVHTFSKLEANDATVNKELNKVEKKMKEVWAKISPSRRKELGKAKDDLNLATSSKDTKVKVKDKAIQAIHQALDNNKLFNQLKIEPGEVLNNALYCRSLLKDPYIQKFDNELLKYIASQEKPEEYLDYIPTNINLPKHTKNKAAFDQLRQDLTKLRAISKQEASLNESGLLTEKDLKQTLDSIKQKEKITVKLLKSIASYDMPQKASAPNQSLVHSDAKEAPLQTKPQAAATPKKAKVTKQKTTETSKPTSLPEAKLQPTVSQPLAKATLRMQAEVDALIAGVKGAAPEEEPDLDALFAEVEKMTNPQKAEESDDALLAEINKTLEQINYQKATTQTPGKTPVEGQTESLELEKLIRELTEPAKPSVIPEIKITPPPEDVNETNNTK